MTTEPVTRLHLLMSARGDAVSTCLAQLGPGDEVLLLDEGVHCLAPDGEHPAQLSALLAAAARVCALETDVRARVPGTHPAVRLVGDDDWVRMVHRHRHVLSWT